MTTILRPDQGESTGGRVSATNRTLAEREADIAAEENRTERTVT